MPSTPLKESKQRGDRWRAAMVREQTELDAAVALAPNEFTKTVDRSLLQYFDRRAADRAQEWKEEEEEEREREANARLAVHLGPELLAEIRNGAEGRLADLRELVDQTNTELRIDPEALDPGVMPDAVEPMIGETAVTTSPLFNTGDGFVENTRRLKARKSY